MSAPNEDLEQAIDLAIAALENAKAVLRNAEGQPIRSKRERPLSLEEAAAQANTSVSTMRRWLKSDVGHLIGSKPGGRWQIWPFRLSAFLESNRDRLP
jgi:hypothetical protein